MHDLLLQQLLAGIGGTLKVLAGVGLDHAGIGAGSQLGVDGALGQHGQAVLCGHLIHMALAEHADLLAAVGADDVAHVLHDAQHGHLHHLSHVHGLGYDHADQLLGAGNDHDAVHGQALEHSQGHVAGSRRHVHEQEVHVLPDHIGPELLDRTGDHGAAPHNGVLLVLDQQVDAHHINAHPALDGPAALFIGHGTAMDAEQLGDGRAGDVGIQDAAVVAPAGHGAGQQGTGHALADTAFARNNADDLFHAAVGVGGIVLRCGGAGRTCCPAGGTVMGTFFAHTLTFSPLF